MAFTPGNTTASKLTPELHDLFGVNTIRITGRISIASGRCAIRVNTARHWIAFKGRLEEEGPYHDFTQCRQKKPKPSFCCSALKRLNQLALGGRTSKCPRGIKTLATASSRDHPGQTARPYPASSDVAAPLVLVEKSACCPNPEFSCGSATEIDPATARNRKPTVPPGPPRAIGGRPPAPKLAPTMS